MTKLLRAVVIALVVGGQGCLSDEWFGPMEIDWEDEQSFNLPAPSPSLKVLTTTIGQELDRDGYVVRIRLFADNGALVFNRDFKHGVNAEVEYSLEPSPHWSDATVSLDDVAANCAVQGETPRGFEGVFFFTAEFQVVCGALP